MLKICDDPTYISNTYILTVNILNILQINGRQTLIQKNLIRIQRKTHTLHADTHPNWSTTFAAALGPIPRRLVTVRISARKGTRTLHAGRGPCSNHAFRQSGRQLRSRIAVIPTGYECPAQKMFPRYAKRDDGCAKSPVYR